MRRSTFCKIDRIYLLGLTSLSFVIRFLAENAMGWRRVKIEGAGRLAALVVLSLAGVAHAQSAPKATPAEVSAAVALSPAIPTSATYQPNWESLAKNNVPKWIAEARFGIMMHWGLYSSTSTHNEWDLKYIYGANAGIAKQFTTNFGP